MHPQPGIDQLSEHLDDMSLERDTHQVSQGAEIKTKMAKESGDLDQKPGSYYNQGDVFNNNMNPSVIAQGQGRQGQQVYNTPNPMVGPSQTLGVRSQTLGAGRGTLPTPIAPPTGKSPSHLSPHTSLLNQPLKPATPTRSGSGYLEHISPLRFPHGQGTPNRRLSFSSMSNLAYSNMTNTAQGSGGVSDNSGSEDNGGVSTNINFQNTGGASMGVNSQGREGVNTHIDSQVIGVASMNDTPQSNAGAVMDVALDDGQGAPRGVPSQAQLPANRQLAMGQGYVYHRFHGGRVLRRMNSTPVMASRPMLNPAPGVGSVHMPSHPAPTAPTLPAGVVDPVTDEVNEFFNTLKIMILEAVQINRYKNGLFVTSITPRTDLVNDMTIMINSAQVTGLDNMRLQNVRSAVEEIKRRVAGGDKISMTILGKKLTIYDFYGNHVGELRDILLSRDKHEHARWLKYYGGGGDKNDGNNDGSGSAVA